MLLLTKLYDDWYANIFELHNEFVNITIAKAIADVYKTCCFPIISSNFNKNLSLSFCLFVDSTCLKRSHLVSYLIRFCIL